MEEFKHTEKVAVKQRDIEKLQSSKEKNGIQSEVAILEKHND